MTTPRQPRGAARFVASALVVLACLWPLALSAGAAQPADRPGPPSADGVQPVIADTRSSNDDCAELGFDHGVAAAGNGQVSSGDLVVTVTGYNTPTGFVDWSSTEPIHGVYVKAGPSGGDLFAYPGGDLGDQDLHTPQKADDGFYAASHVAFCWNDASQEPDVTIAKANDPTGEVAPGAEITYTLSVHNVGTGDAAGVTVSDPLPAGVSLVSATPGCSGSAGSVTCALGDVGPGAGLTVQIVVSVDEETCGVLTNAAHVAAANESGAAEGNNASNQVSNTVVCDEPTPPDLVVEKSSSAQGVLGRGDELTYTITVRNVGDETATGVRIHDALPPGVEVRIPPLPSFQGEFCTVASSVVVPGVPVATVDCGPGSLEPGAAASIEVRVGVTGDPCGPITNEVDVEATNEPAELVGSENHADVTDQVACVPRIELVKGGPVFAHVGDPITYVFVVTNTGGVDLTDVELTDAACETPIVLEDGGDGDEVLVVAEAWSYRCDRKIRASDGDLVHNEASVVASHESGTVSDSAAHDVEVIHPAIALEKTASPISGTEGTTITYTYRVTNVGDTRLFGVSVDDDVVGHIATIAGIAPGQSVEVTHTFTLGPSPVTNIGTAEGEDLIGASVRASDTATVSVVAGGTGGSGGTPFTGSSLRAAIGWLIVLSACALAALTATTSSDR